MAPVAEAKIATESVFGGRGHPPGGEEHGGRAGAQKAEPGEGDVGDVVRVFVIIVLVHKVVDEDEDVQRAPAHGKDGRHGDEIVLGAFFLGQIQVVVRVLRGALGGVGLHPGRGVAAVSSG